MLTGKYRFNSILGLLEPAKPQDNVQCLRQIFLQAIYFMRFLRIVRTRSVNSWRIWIWYTQDKQTYDPQQRIYKCTMNVIDTRRQSEQRNFFYGISGFLRTPTRAFICGNSRSFVQVPIMLNTITYTIRKPTISCYDNLFLGRWCFYKSELRSRLSCFLFKLDSTSFSMNFVFTDKVFCL